MEGINFLNVNLVKEERKSNNAKKCEDDRIMHNNLCNSRDVEMELLMMMYIIFILKYINER